MEGRLTRLLAATAAALAVGGVGFAVGAAGADSDPVAGMQEMHDEMHEGHAHMGAGHHGSDMDGMHAEMSRRLSPDDCDLSGRPGKDSAPSTDADDVAEARRAEVTELRHRQQDPSQLPGRP